MKKLKYILALMVGASFTASCVDDFKLGDAFLEKAPGVDVNVDTIFSKAEHARNFLWNAYAHIYCTYTRGNMMNGAPIDVLSDSYQCYVNWGGPIQSYYPGTLNEDCQDTPNGNFQGKFSYSTLGEDRVSIYEAVRICWQFIENVDKVKDMDEAEKLRLKGEAYTIMASRYFDAFRSFGGLCLIDHAYNVGEEFTSGRSTAWETFQFIDGLLQKAIACAKTPDGKDAFIWAIPNEDLGQWAGRLTRASARALRCKLWMHAASPIFNNSKPYMEYEASKVTEFTNIQHVWFGKEDKSLWDSCYARCKEFFDDNDHNTQAPGYYALVMPETKDEAGYRMAYRNAYRYRNTEKNHEKLFDAHPTTTLSGGAWGWGWAGFALDCYRQGGAVPTAELVECFGMADGTNSHFEDMDIYGPGKNPDGIDIFVNRDPRLYETVAVPRQNFPSGVVGDFRGHNYVDTWEKGILSQVNDFRDDDHYSGLNKFKWMLDYDNAKMDDKAIGVAYIRLAEIYLIKAEALAEMGRNQEAIKEVNTVRARVGLGDLNEKNPELNLLTNKENLINEILRERNCEIGGECGDRVYDMIRRMRQDLFTKPLHELHTWRLDENGKRRGVEGTDDTNTTYTEGEPWPKFEYDRNVISVGARRWWEPGYWTNKWYLDPVSRTEVQKGYGLTQNPGW